MFCFVFHFIYTCARTNTQHTQDSMLMKADSVESITTDLDEIHGELYLENPRKIMHEQLLTSFKYHYTCKKFVILIMHE